MPTKKARPAAKKSLSVKTKSRKTSHLEKQSQYISNGKQFPVFVFALSIIIVALISLVAIVYTIGLGRYSESRIEKELEAQVDAFLDEVEGFSKELMVDDFADIPNPESENFLKANEMGLYEDTLEELRKDFSDDKDLFDSEPEF